MWQASGEKKAELGGILAKHGTLCAGNYKTVASSRNHSLR